MKCLALPTFPGRFLVGGYRLSRKGEVGKTGADGEAPLRRVIQAISRELSLALIGLAPCGKLKTFEDLYYSSFPAATPC